MRCLLVIVFTLISAAAQDAEIPKAVLIEEYTPTLPKAQMETAQLQIFLDQKNFGPGVIDGKMGTYTKMAIEAYNKHLGRETSQWDTVKTEAAESITTVFATAIVPEIVVDMVDAEFLAGSDREYQSTRHDMPYRSVAEFMAERYHTSVDFLTILNGEEAIKNLTLRSALFVPNIEPFRIELLAEGRTFHKDATLSKRWAVVDTERNQIRIYEPLPKLADQAEASPEERSEETKEEESDPINYDETNASIVAAYPITPGKPEFIRHGTWEMVNSIELPTWRFDASLLETGERSSQSLTIPSGPNNPVGVLWMGLSRKGIGIHGTDDPEKIGRGRSAGCIRMANWDVVKIPKLIRPGATVIIK